VGLYISYWRCNFTRTIRIMRDDHVPVGELKLKGRELTQTDQREAEKLKAQLEAQMLPR
jgi:hypothetical protein